MLTATANTSPVVISIDGAQWADDLSLEIFSEIIQSDISCFFIFSYRPNAYISSRFHAIDAIQIPPLSHQARKKLMEYRCNAEVSKEVYELINSKSQGNPYFILELIHALFKNKTLQVEKKNGHAYVTYDDTIPTLLPPSVVLGVFSNVDTIDSLTQRNTLRWLSVFGAPCTEKMLSTIVDYDLSDSLQALVDAEFLNKDNYLYSFQNPLTNQVVYRSIEVVDRMTMHRRIASYMADRYMSSTKVAFHFEQAGDKNTAAHHYLNAAESIVSPMRSREALSLYSRSLKLFSPRETKARLRAHMGRENIFSYVGQKTKQQNELNHIHKLTKKTKDLHALHAYLIKKIQLDIDTGNHTSAKKELKKLFEYATYKTTQLKAKHLEINLLSKQHKTKEALDACEAILKTLNDQHSMLKQKALFLYQKGVLLQTSHPNTALDIFIQVVVITQRLKIGKTQARSLSSLAEILVSQMKYDDAILAYRNALYIYSSHGWLAEIAQSMVNIGKVYSAIEHSEKASAFLKKASEIYQIMENHEGYCNSLLRFIECQIKENIDPTYLLKELDNSRTVAKQYDLQKEKVYERFLRSQLEFILGNWHASKQKAEEALVLTSRSSMHCYQIPIYIQLAYAYLKLEETKEALVIANQCKSKIDSHHIHERWLLMLGNIFEELNAKNTSSMLYQKANDQVIQKKQSLYLESLRSTYMASSTAQLIHQHALQS